MARAAIEACAERICGWDAAPLGRQTGTKQKGAGCTGDMRCNTGCMMFEGTMLTLDRELR